MSTPCSFKTTLVAIFLLIQSLVLLSQDQTKLHQYDKQISYFITKDGVDSAIYYLTKKADLAKQADSLALWGQTHVDIHELFENDYVRAFSYLDAVWDKRWRDPKNSQEWRPFMIIHANKGWFHTKMGRIWQSLQSYEHASKLYDQFKYPDFDAVRFFYKAYGNNYVRLGDNDKAIAVFQKALACETTTESLAGLYCDIGIAYWNKGDYIASAENYLKGLGLPGVSPVKRALLLGALAQTELDNGQSAKASVTAAQSLALLRTEKDERAYRCYSRRTAGVASTRLGRFKEAGQLLSGALDDAIEAFGPHSRDVGKIEVARSQLLLRQGQALLALDAANRALSAVIPSFQPGPTNPLLHTSPNPPINLFYEENTIFEALTAKAAAAQALFEKSGQTRWLELALECHDLAWQSESILRQIYQYSSSKLNLQKDARAREEAAMNVARLLFEKTGQSAWLERAFAIAERSKASLLLEALQDNLIRQRLTGSDKRFNELTSLRQSLSYFDKNLLLEPGSDKVPEWRIEADNIRTQVATLEQSLGKDYPSLSALEISTADWLPVNADFSVGEALAAYFISEHWVDVFVFQEAKPGIWKRIPNDAELQGLIRRYLAYFENDYAILNDPAGYFQIAFELWQKILPAETATASVLTILPDGILNFVPFEALITSVENTPNLRNAAYLLRKQEVRYAWSLAVLRQQKNLKSHASNYLLSIAPGFANRERGLAPLASADFDWRGIAGWDIQNLRGQSADLQHFLKFAGDYRVLHFSTHAFAGENPRIELMDSSLLLPDLYALPLQADLVMLSACETGLGKEAKGEGVMSLARAFAQAGAACIVSSLWSVNDQSTSRLLRFFYDNIGQGHTTSAALHEAKLAYLADLKVGSAAQSPYFWAGLVAVGDDRVIEQPWGWGMWGIMLAGIGVLIFVGWNFWRKFKTSTHT